MDNKTISECDKDYFLFLEAGFVAVNNTDEDSALKLFMATQILRPENHFYKIGFGYMHMCKLELKQAEEMFASVLKSDPKNEMAMSFLAICKSMMPGKVTEGEKMLADIANTSADSDIKELVNRSRDFIDNFVKKGTKSPMDIAKPKKKE
jgi:cytochrome c-type biogenesis protein CcmH/NrfG